MQRRTFISAVWAISAIWAILLSACSSQGNVGAPPAPTSSPVATAAFPTRVIDFQGRDVQIAKQPQRIVSIGPSNTEFLFALGAGDRVVGVDGFSNYPIAATTKPKVGDVKVDLEKVISLRPDLVTIIKFSDGTLDRLLGAGLTVLIVDPQGISDVPRTAQLLGKAVGGDGDAMASDITRRLDALRERTKAIAQKPRVFHEVDATDPAKPFTVGPGSFINDMIELAGGVNVAPKNAGPFPQISAEELVRTDPEVIVLADADYGTTVAQVKARPGWGQLSAVRTDRIYPVNADLYSRPGPRIADAAEAYAKLLHPTLR